MGTRQDKTDLSWGARWARALGLALIARLVDGGAHSLAGVREPGGRLLGRQRWGFGGLLGRRRAVVLCGIRRGFLGRNGCHVWRVLFLALDGFLCLLARGDALASDRGHDGEAEDQLAKVLDVSHGELMMGRGGMCGRSRRC